jgi:hypothetical protein
LSLSNFVIPSKYLKNFVLLSIDLSFCYTHTFPTHFGKYSFHWIFLCNVLDWS